MYTKVAMRRVTMRSFLLSACQLAMRQAATTPDDEISKKQLITLVAALWSSIIDIGSHNKMVFNDQDVNIEFVKSVIDIII